jgi:hypothetical protein
MKSDETALKVIQGFSQSVEKMGKNAWQKIVKQH